MSPGDWHLVTQPQNTELSQQIRTLIPERCIVCIKIFSILVTGDPDDISYQGGRDCIPGYHGLSLFVCPKIFYLILTVGLRGGSLMAAGESLFLAHKGNIFRPFLPPAVLRNKPWRGEEPHTRPAETRPFLLPQDTAEMLCHPQVDTCILPVTFTFLSRNFALSFPLPEITVCFPCGQAVAVVPCCLWCSPGPCFPACTLL